MSNLQCCGTGSNKHQIDHITSNKVFFVDIFKQSGHHISFFNLFMKVGLQWHQQLRRLLLWLSYFAYNMMESKLCQFCLIYCDSPLEIPYCLFYFSEATCIISAASAAISAKTEPSGSTSKAPDVSLGKKKRKPTATATVSALGMSTDVKYSM